MVMRSYLRIENIGNNNITLIHTDHFSINLNALPRHSITSVISILSILWSFKAISAARLEIPVILTTLLADKKT